MNPCASINNDMKPGLPPAPGSISAFVNGKQTGAEGYRIPVINPADETVLTQIIETDAAGVDLAVAAAEKSFRQGEWSRCPVRQRKYVLSRTAELLRQNRHELAAMDSMCAGLCYFSSTLRQVAAAADWFDYFAAFIETRQNEYFPQLEHAKTFINYEPLGVVALFSPWNIPLMSAALKLSAALAFGNSCVLKPSEQSPWATLRLVELIHAAGLPAGVVNVVNGRGPVTGAALSQHPAVKAISFTGGEQAGRAIAAPAAERFARLTMELGGKSANIIFADADIEHAMDAALLSAFGNNGQACLAGSRILIEAGIFPDFVREFSARARQIRLGDPLHKETELGPQSSKAQMRRVLSYLDIAKHEGMEILCGGKAAGFEKGYYIEPIVAMSNKAGANKSRICQEEIFGPFAALLPFTDLAEAVQIANDTRFGLAAYVWTGDYQKAWSLSERLRAGYVMVNSIMQREPNAPFGGYAQSGLGREGGQYSMQFFTEAKTVVMADQKHGLLKLGTGSD